MQTTKERINMEVATAEKFSRTIKFLFNMESNDSQLIFLM